MRTRSTYIFLFVLMILIGAYLYASHKMVIYNHSGYSIETIRVESEFMKREIKAVKNGEKIKFSLFSPFDKKVSIKVRQQNGIKSTVFHLQGFLLGEDLNQVEIVENGIKHGALGL